MPSNLGNIKEITCFKMLSKKNYQFMIVNDRKNLITHSEYIKKLRPLIPSEAFLPSINKFWILLINMAILLMGWNIASYLDQWSWYYLWLYIPMALIMANSISVFQFVTHDLLHTNIIKNQQLRWVVSLFGFAMQWVPPTLWKAVHNREHHNKANSLDDPDRNYLQTQSNSWCKLIQNFFVPSSNMSPLFLIIGLTHSWGVYIFRNLSSILLFNDGLSKYPPASFQVSSKERRAIAIELLLLIGIHFSILAYLEFNPIKVLLGYFLPIWLGHSIFMYYIFTNHLLCPMTSINDPLVNSLSLRVPKIFDLLHFNFSYHTEHHLFPNMNSDYYPLLQELLKTEYPERFNLLDGNEAWHLLLNTPRFYKDENTFTNWDGQLSVNSPL